MSERVRFLNYHRFFFETVSFYPKCAFIYPTIAPIGQQMRKVIETRSIVISEYYLVFKL